MQKVKQKKFFSNEQVNEIVEAHAKKHDWSWSKSLRHIVLDWAGKLERIPKVGAITPDGDIEFWKSKAGMDEAAARG